MDTNNELLEYIYQDATMGAKSLTNLINTIHGKDNKIISVVEDKLKEYEKYIKESQKLLSKHQVEPKEPSMMANLGSAMGIKMEMMKDNSDARVADMIIKGFTMGILDLDKKIDKYKGVVDSKILKLAKDFKSFQEKSIQDLKPYL